MSARITSIQTAFPIYSIKQQRALEFMSAINDLSQEESHKLEVLYRATGIENRYSVISDYTGKENGEFFQKPDFSPSTSDRLKRYSREALQLSVESAKKCLINRGIEAKAIDHLIYVSCTGMQAPGIDIELVKSLGLRKNVDRTAINFMGCYAAFTALKLAKSICNSSDSKVLIICTELCTLHFQKGKDDDNLLANALFGDGSSAVLVESKYEGKSLEIKESFCDLLIDGENEMAWQIGDFGFEMKLSSYVPDVIAGGIDTLLSNFNQKFDYYAIHPGGKKILSVIEQALNIQREDNKWAHNVLRDHGNMSSPTVLFVLSSIFNQLEMQDHDKSILSMAFGPGITLESIVFKIHFNA